MGSTVIRWNLTKLTSMIVRILQNKFDCVIIIEGNRGLGKSTLAIHIARRVAREFKKLGQKKYKFHWMHSLVYSKKETKRFLHKWESTGIADEMINVTFNRDFYNEEQKDIIKMINMNRDHRNLFIACVPQFQTLDNQIKNLCKLKITVVRRGFAIIQTPNRTIYIKDKWDSATNEKIERDWIKKGIRNPHYTKLTTFRGVLKFPALHPTSEEKYQNVKDLKRNRIAQEEMGIEEETEEDPIKKIIDKLKNNKIKNGSVIDGMAYALDLNPNTLKNNLRDKLRAEGLNHHLSEYYWEKKSKATDKTPYEEREKDIEIINSLKERIGK